jgi:hypothetical protein
MGVRCAGSRNELEESQILWLGGGFDPFQIHFCESKSNQCA